MDRGRTYMTAVDIQRIAKKGRCVSLSEVSFRAEEGEVTCLHGPPGSGKSVLVKIIAGLLRPDEGRCRVFGQDPFSSANLSRRFSLVLEHGSIPSRLYLDDFLLHASRLYGFREEDARMALRLLDLWGERHQRICRLPLHKAEIAKFLLAVCRKPDLLLIDGMEKVLDDENMESIYSRLFEMVRTSGTSMLVSTSRRRLLLNFADKLVEMREGKIANEIAVSGRGITAGRTMCRIRVSDVVRGSTILNALRVEGNSIILREPAEGLSSSISALERSGIRVLALERMGEEASA